MASATDKPSDSPPISSAPIVAAETPPRARQSIYPPVLAAVTEGRLKRPLGDHFGLKNFGVNHTRLAPGSASALRHAHSVQDEFVYVLAGRVTLINNAGAFEMEPGMCAGFRGGTGDAHHFVNRSSSDVIVLEIGDRRPDDQVTYPDDDLQVRVGPNGPRFSRKDGTPWDDTTE